MAEPPIDVGSDYLELVEAATGRVLATSRALGPAEVSRLLREGGLPEGAADVYRVSGQQHTRLTLRPHESAVRSMVADSDGTTYEPLLSLQDARRDPIGAVVIEGDDGGQIHATAPASIVACSEQRLERLATELEEIAWPGNETGSVRVFFERIRADGGVVGGMGGGVVTGGVWVHGEFRQLGMGRSITRVILGEADELDAPEPDVTEGFTRRVVAAYHGRPSPFWWIFGFPQSEGKSLTRDDWESAFSQPHGYHGYSRWYSSTVREVARRAGLEVLRPDDGKK